MKKTVLVGLLTGLWLTGCSPNDPAPNENLDLLYQRFHGKYKAIRSEASEAIDVNLDGQVSTDMLTEIPALTATYQNYLELRVYAAYKRPVFLFTQWWPEQEIFVPTNKTQRWEGEDIPYQPDLLVNYAMQATPRSFSFSTDLKQIAVSSNKSENLFRWVRPESVTVEGNNRTRIVNKRRLYTRQGVKEVTITTTYERFTMTT